MNASVDIVMVTHRAARETLTSLQLLVSEGLIGPDGSSGSAGLRVLDAASGDGTPDRLLAAHPALDLWRHDENVGFARGVNLLASRSGARFLCLLNPDATIGASDLQILVRALLDDPAAAAAGPRFEDPHGRAPHIGSPVPTLRTELRRSWGGGLAQAAPCDGAEPRAVPWTSGACMVVRRDEFLASGGFDERFFLYYEETDWCRRMATAGRRILHCPLAVARHEGGASARDSGERLRGHELSGHRRRSRYRYFRKHEGALAATIIRISDELRSRVDRLRERTGARS